MNHAESYPNPHQVKSLSYELRKQGVARAVAKIVVILFSLFLFSNCGIQERNDIYHSVPLGSKLTLKILKESDQIFIYGNDLIVAYSLKADSDFYSGHLLFYDSNRNLNSACFFHSSIESISNDTIYGYINSDNAGLNRRNWYRKDTPENYHLSLKIENEINKEGFGITKKCDKIIEKMELNFDSNRVTLFIKRVKDKEQNIDWYHERKGDGFYKQFTIDDKIIIQLSKLRFDHKNGVINTQTLSNNSWLIDEMPIINDSVYQNFYDQLLSWLIPKNEKK